MSGVLDAIGNTPMIRVASLSEATGCDILIKCEFANPGGSVKDRVALRILREALSSGRLRPGGVVTEGTAGSTGVSLAMVARALGCEAHLAFPDDAAAENPRSWHPSARRRNPCDPSPSPTANTLSTSLGDARRKPRRNAAPARDTSRISSRTWPTIARTWRARGQRFGDSAPR